MIAYWFDTYYFSTTTLLLVLIDLVVTIGLLVVVEVLLVAVVVTGGVGDASFVISDMTDVATEAKFNNAFTPSISLPLSTC